MFGWKRKFKEGQQKLEEVQAERDITKAGAYALVHDIKGNVGRVLNLVGFLEDEPENKDFLRKLGVEIRNLSKRVSQRTESISGKEKIEMVNLAELISEEKKSFVDQLEKKNINLLDDMQTEKKAFCDEGWVRTILYNLLSNAVKYSPRGGEIKISVEDNGKNQLLVSVKDQGKGIPKENVSKIFNPGETTKETADSQGLGLSICQVYVHGWGGKIWVESEEGRGSTFKFTLPEAPGK